MNGFYWARPAWLAALALPLAIWWLARRPRSPAETATGTLAVWREVAAEALPAAARRRAPWLLLAALCLGALALAGPRTPRASERTWRLVVDRSPSMHLPATSAGGQTRLERALQLADAELQRRGAHALRYLAYDGVSFVASEGSAVPSTWLHPPPTPHPEPAWARIDLPRTLWITDRRPAAAPRNAGLVLSGGAAMPGPAAVMPDGALLVFDGQTLQPSARRASRRALWIDANVPAPVRGLAELWSSERGLVLAAERGEEAVALAISGPGSGARQPVRIGRDGWELDATALSGGLPQAASRADPALDFELAPLPWLFAADAVWVWSAPARVELAFDDAAEPRGDPAAFALSWSTLFDASLAPPREVVPVAERLAAGEEHVQLPPDEEQPTEVSPWLEALCAAAAALLALAARWREWGPVRATGE